MWIRSPPDGAPSPSREGAPSRAFIPELKKRVSPDGAYPEPTRQHRPLAVLLHLTCAIGGTSCDVPPGRVEMAQPEVIHIEASSPLLRGVIVVRRVEPMCVVLTTFVFYQRPVTRIVWALAGSLHRRVVPYLLMKAASAPNVGADFQPHW